MRSSGKREMRGLAFLVIAIVMAVALCVASLVSGNIFSMVFSILLVGTLCVGLGYQYCKHEDEIEAYFVEGARKREESYKAENIMAKHIEAAIKYATPEPKLEGEKEVGEEDDAE